MPDPPNARRVAAYRFGAAVTGVVITSTVGGLGVVAAYYPLRDAPYFAQWMLVFVLMAAESAAVHLPSEVILPVAGWLVVRDHHLGIAGVIAVSAVAAAGNTCGSLALYVAGRSGGRPLVRRYGRWVLVREEDIDAAARKMRRHTGWTNFLARLLPVVRTYSGFAAGLLRVPVRSFIATTFAGSFAWCIGFVAVGAVLGSHWSAVRGPAEIAGIALVGLLLLALVVATVVQLRAAPQAA